MLADLFKRMAQSLKTLVGAPEYNYECGDAIRIKELTIHELQEKSSGAPFSCAELIPLEFEFIAVEPGSAEPYAATILNYKVKPKNVACTGVLRMGEDEGAIRYQYVLQIPLP
jgi:hypothetical protein